VQSSAAIKQQRVIRSVVGALQLADDHRLADLVQSAQESPSTPSLKSAPPVRELMMDAQSPARSSLAAESDGQHVHLDVPGAETVAQLKGDLEKATGIASSKQRVVVDGNKVHIEAQTPNKPSTDPSAFRPKLVPAPEVRYTSAVDDFGSTAN
jgi:hypothetical protein